MFHKYPVWFHLLLWDLWRQDLWSVLQCQRVSAASLHVLYVYKPERMSDYWNVLVFTGLKCVNCLYRGPMKELCSTSAHFLRWTFTCLWKYTSRLWSATPTLPCTIGPSVSKITVRKVFSKSKIFNKSVKGPNKTWTCVQVVFMLPFLNFLFGRY